MFLFVDGVGGDLSAQLGEEYQAVVEQNACITLQISKCTTIGPPRVGKTCLKYLLIGQTWDMEKGTASTNAMEAPEWVEVFREDENSTWTRLDHETRKDNLIYDMALRNYDEDNKPREDQTAQTAECGDKQTEGRYLVKTGEGVERFERDVEKIGGDVEKTGEVGKTGEGVEKPGGDVEKTGGDVEKTGGDVEKTGGDVEKTGGDVEKTGGDVKKTGGDVEKTGGGVEKSGGDVEKSGGDVENTIRTYSEEIRELQSTYEGEFFHQKLEEARRNPKEAMKTRKFLHFVDTGGQRIYHDVHPVLITSPSVYLVVINLVDCAREHGILPKHPEELDNIDPTVHHKKELISSSKQSSTATKHEDVGSQEMQPLFMSKDSEAMNLAERALRSIQTFTSKQSGEGKYFNIQPRQPKVFIVGTHLDKICPNDSEGRQSALEELHQYIECKIQEKPYFQFIQYDDKFRCFWAVDNTLAGDENLQGRDPKMYQYLSLLRSLIQEQSMMFNVKIPVKWQIFEHLTCHQSHFRYKELLDFALDKRFVDNQKEFNSMLRVFHILSLYYFRVPHMYMEQSMENLQSHIPRDTAIIFTKPDALYKATTELLKSAKLIGDKMVDVRSHLDRLMSSKKIVDIDRDWFAGLLCDLRLMAVGKFSHEFIIPAALPAKGKTTKESNSDFSVGSLFVTFFSPRSHESFIPSGLFCALVSEVLTFPEFKPKYLYRDHIVLSVSEFDAQCGDLYIIEQDVYIEIAFRTTTNDGLETLAELSRKCNNIRKFLHRRINVVWQRIYEEQRSSEILWDPSMPPKDLKAITWGFPCVHHPDGAHISEYQEDEMMFCATCLGCTSSLIQEVSPSQQVWFQSLTGEVSLWPFC